MKHRLAVAAIVKDEGPYLQEWIQFHLLQGVKHFYIVDDNSKDETESVLEPYINEGLVTYHLWPEMKGPQMPAYQFILDNYKGECQWIAFLDSDEFLYSEGITVSSFLENLTKQNPYMGALAVHWYLFGSANEVMYKPLSVTQRFTYRATRPDKHVKSIVRTIAVDTVGRNPHVFYLKKGYQAVNENGKILPKEYATLENPTAKIIRINHYHTKSYEEYLARKQRPDVGSGVLHSPERVEEMFKAHDLNDVPDFSALEVMKGFC